MKITKIAAALSLATISVSAFATDGYFSHGYGMKAKGMGGAATAMASDAFGGANNPASMVWAGGRLDVGVDLFAPKRSAERTGSTAGINGSADSGSNLFLVPEFGYNRMLGTDMSVGITVYGNGGMNTDYGGGQIPAGPGTCGVGGGGFNTASGQTGPYNLLCGSGKLGMNLEQLIISPTFSMKLNKDHSVGGSLLIGYQAFKAEGLSAFYSFTANGQAGVPYAAGNNITNKGKDTSWGYGLKFGWMGKMSDTVTLGASYTTKMKMGKFDKYKDLFAGQGYFDMPASLNLGISVKATPTITVAADYQRIDYSGIKSIANPSTNLGAAFLSLGCDTCRGFGWSSVDVFKLGVEYQYSSNLTLRAGYNHTDNPITGRDVTFNIIAPGVVKDHLTAGFTYGLSKDSELTMSYMHAFKNSVQASSLFNTWMPGMAGTEKIQMYQDSLGIAYGMKF